jgi:hypothetical protein
MPNAGHRLCLFPTIAGVPIGGTGCLVADRHWNQVGWAIARMRGVSPLSVTRCCYDADPRASANHARSASFESFGPSGRDACVKWLTDARSFPCINRGVA